MRFEIKPEWKEPIRFGLVILMTVSVCFWIPSVLVWAGWLNTSLPWDAEAGTFVFGLAFTTLLGVWKAVGAAGQVKEQAEIDDTQARRDLIANQRNAHIDGVLRQRLHEQVRIVLNLDDAPMMLQRTLATRMGLQRRPIAAGTPVLDLFQRSGRKLLILGAPGAGKTIMLLELLRDLLTQADNDEHEPIPVYPKPLQLGRY